MTVPSRWISHDFPPLLWRAASKACARGYGTSDISKAGISPSNSRWAASSVSELAQHAPELARMNVDLIFATSSSEAEAARQASQTIAVVFATHADPVGVGHVVELFRGRVEA